VDERDHVKLIIGDDSVNQPIARRDDEFTKVLIISFRDDASTSSEPAQGCGSSLSFALQDDGVPR
jgi:hypothetical protein